MDPQRYKDEPHERLGYLARPAARPSGRPANHPALQALVVQRWQAFATDRAATSCADRLRRLQLLRQGWTGFAAAVAEARARHRAATVQCQKRSFLTLGASFSAWQERVANRRRLAGLLCEAAGLREAALARRALAALRQHAQRRRALQLAWTRAGCFHSFCTLAKGLDAWREWRRQQHAKRRATQRAALHAARSLRLRSLAAWRRWAAQRQQSKQAMQLAEGFDRARQLGRPLAAWRLVSEQLEARRAQAEQLIHRALFGLDVGLLSLALRGWRQLAERCAALRESVHIAQRLDRFNTLQHCWQG